MSETTRPPFIDRPEIGEIFADGIQTVSLSGGVITVALTVMRAQQDAPTSLARVLAGRVVLTLPAVIDLHQRLGNMMTVLQKQYPALAAKPPGGEAPAAEGLPQNG
jgi:hypothetical protein